MRSSLNELNPAYTILNRTLRLAGSGRRKIDCTSITEPLIDCQGAATRGNSVSALRGSVSRNTGVSSGDDRPGLMRQVRMVVNQLVKSNAQKSGISRVPGAAAREQSRNLRERKEGKYG